MMSCFDFYSYSWDNRKEQKEGNGRRDIFVSLLLYPGKYSFLQGPPVELVDSKTAEVLPPKRKKWESIGQMMNDRHRSDTMKSEKRKNSRIKAAPQGKALATPLREISTDSQNDFTPLLLLMICLLCRRRKPFQYTKKRKEGILIA